MIRNPFGGNAFGNGLAGPFPGPLPQPGFGQYGNAGGYYNGNIPFQGGNMFPAGGVVFPPRSFSPGPMNGQFGPNFGGPLIPPGNGYMNQQIPYPLGPQQMEFVEPNHFGSGAFGRPRSRHRSTSRHRRRRHSRSSSPSDDELNPRGSPFAGPEISYQNLPPFQNVPPLFPQRGSPVIPPRRPLW
jgi:hypothetical protein